MNTIGNILQFFGARTALIVAISLIIAFSIWKAETILQGIRISCILVVFGGFLAAVPVFVVFLVTNGDVSLLNLGRVGGWADRAAIGFDFLIPVFLIVVPSLLRQRVPWGSRGPAVQALLTAWFAIFAAAATVGLVSMLHFVQGGQLANMRPTLVMAATVGIVSLILPLYGLLIRACWQHGYWLGFYQPPQWWRDQKAAWTVLWSAIRPKRAAASSSPPADSDYLGGLLAALMLRHCGQPIPLPMMARIRQVTQLDAATGISPDKPAGAPLDKLLTELSDMVQVNAPAANADGYGSAA
jgi:hypothetical protein